VPSKLKLLTLVGLTRFSTQLDMIRTALLAVSKEKCGQGEGAK